MNRKMVSNLFKLFYLIVLSDEFAGENVKQRSISQQNMSYIL